MAYATNPASTRPSELKVRIHIVDTSTQVKAS
jgi:hypothetical protein